jgi:hypothetical protein
MQKRQKEAYDKELDKLLEGATVRLNPDIVDAGISK